MRRRAPFRPAARALVVADVEVIAERLVPAHATWWVVFARDRMTLGHRDGSAFARRLAREPWHRVATAPGVALGRSDPALDPAGYRALLAAGSPSGTSASGGSPGGCSPPRRRRACARRARTSSRSSRRGSSTRHGSTRAPRAQPGSAPCRSATRWTSARRRSRSPMRPCRCGCGGPGAATASRCAGSRSASLEGEGLALRDGDATWASCKALAVHLC